MTVHPPEFCSLFTCKAIIISGTCDLPAKSTALNMVGHNGFYACPYCEQSGSTLSLGRGHVHTYRTYATTQLVHEHMKVLKCVPRKATSMVKESME